jgi:hypothetical protein
MPRSLIFFSEPSLAKRRRKPMPGMIAMSGGLPPEIRDWSVVE